MKDPTPVQRLLLIQLLAAVVLAAWWASQSAPVREARLLAVMTHEQATMPPPHTFLDQPGWLFDHRLVRLQRMTGLLVLALVIGMCEGWAQRRQDVLGGFRLTPWTIGVMGGALIPGAVGAYLLLPWPLPFVGASAVLAALSGGVAYCLWRGRPQTL